jgi:outer membrane protein
LIQIRTGACGLPYRAKRHPIISCPEESVVPIQHRLSLALLVSLVGVSTVSHAQNAGDFLVRGGVGYVSPNTDSGNISGVPGGKVDVKSSTGATLTFAYLMTDRIGVELLGSLPFKHDIEGAGTLAGTGKLAETKQLPPTVLLQYYFNPQGTIRPYVGAGVNYTTFFSTKTTGVIAGTSIDLKDSWGLAGEAGVDVDLGGNWFANAAVWYVDIKTKATISGGVGTVDVGINPWVGSVGIGYRF